jgi:phosphotransferase system enzyme I (PtsI)
MLIKKGIPVSPGVVITKAVVLDAEDQPVSKRTVPPARIPDELTRLQHALEASSKDIEQLRAQAEAQVGSQLARIFGAHLSTLHDKTLTDQFRTTVQQEAVTAEYAVYSVMRQWAQKFSKIENRYFRERAGDIWDVERHILGHLLGERRALLEGLQSDSAIIAHDLTPSQTASFDRTKVRAIATDLGGRTSHTAILAHALGIPAIVGLEHLAADVATGDTVIVDANSGQVIVNPDAAKLLEYRSYVQRMAKVDATLDRASQLPAQTLDGTPITVQANIEFPDEIVTALAKGATGIGLFRTEFLFLASGTEPSEEQQFEAYRQAIKLLGGRPLTIRTLDLGADKLLRPNDGDSAIESNPFLGCRSIRLCLQNLPLFKTQLRAILRASAEGPIRVMFPMISSVMELRQAKMVLNDVMEDLEEQGIPFRHNLPVGMMVEVPSAALQSATYSGEIDFFSIGTNDLIQYTLAVDRGNERIANLYSAAHPSVIQLIKETIRAANRAKIDVSLCGEMAGEPWFVPLLLGLGLRSLSLTPPAVPEVKRVIRSISITQCQRIARRVAGFESDREVLNYLQDQLQRIIPEVFDGRSME